MQRTETTQSFDGTEIHYSDTAGDRRAVVLVHGITESSDSMQPVAERLADAGNRVVALDLRGHGRSGTADTYDLGSMAADVVAVATAAELDRPHLIGHSLGGAVVSAAGAVMRVSSVVNVDQALRLGSFKEMLTPVEAMLRDTATFPAVMQGVFEQLAGPLLSSAEKTRLSALRQPKQEVVLGVWDLIFTQPVAEIDATVEAALEGYATNPVPYLSLFGADPGDGYAEWLAKQIPGAQTEIWPDHGHYPHLVDLDRFIKRLQLFWTRP